MAGNLYISMKIYLDDFTYSILYKELPNFKVKSLGMIHHDI